MSAKPRRRWTSRGQYAEKDRAADKAKQDKGGSAMGLDLGVTNTVPLYTNLDAGPLRLAQLQVTARAVDIDEAQLLLAMLDLIPNPYGDPPRHDSHGHSPWRRKQA